MRKNFSLQHGVAHLAFGAATLFLHAGAQAQTYNENPNAAVLGPAVVSGIRNDEIFQRSGTQETSEATIYLNVSQSIPPAAYKHYTVSLLAANNVRERILSSGDFTGTSPLQFSLATGLARRKVRVSFYDVNYVERLRWDSPGFSVGEVFLVAGQSNAANHGDTGGSPLTANLLHRAVDPVSATWTALGEAMPYATAWAAPLNGSPWPIFADALGQKINVPVGIVNVAVGGSAVEFWLPGAKDFSGNLTGDFERLKLAAAALTHSSPTGPSCGFRAVLWHQGESNSERAAPDRTVYANDLTRVAQAFRTATACAQPWMIAKATWLSDEARLGDKLTLASKFPAEQAIRQAQHYLATRVPASSAEPAFLLGPDTDVMVGERYSSYRFDGTHFSRYGLTLHGQLWAERVGGMLGQPAQPVPEESVYEYKSVRDLYESVLGRTDDEMALDPEGPRYWVQHLEQKQLALADISTALQNSDEMFVRTTFPATLGRKASWPEVNYWVREMAAGRMTRAQLPSAIAYEKTLSANGQKLFLLYVNVLSRSTPEVQNDQAGFTYWLNVLNSGVSEAAIADAFRASDEYLVRAAFVQAKLRQPSTAELLDFMGKLNTIGRANKTKLVDAIWADPR